MELAPSRILARNVVTQVRTKHSYANEVLRTQLDKEDYSRQDIGYGTRLAFVAVAARVAVEPLIREHLKSPDKLDSKVMDCLVISLVEMLYLAVPDHVVVSQGVELVKSVAPHCAGVANAVLRKLASKKDSFPWANVIDDAAAHGLLHGFPQWIAEGLRRDYGFEQADAIMSASNTEAPQYAQIMPFRFSREHILDEFDIAGTTVDVIGDASLRIHSPRSINNHPYLTERDVIIADLAAQQAVKLANIQPGERVLDIGCGRGSKTLMMAASARRLGGKATVVGADIHKHKTELLARDARRLGVKELSTIVSDVTEISDHSLEVYGPFDVVFIDAPCTGLGTLRRHPDKRSTVTADDVDTLAGIGSQMLERAIRLVSRGGRIIYSTCTLRREENTEVVNGFLASDAGSSCLIDAISPDELFDEFSGSLNDCGMFQSVPTVGGPDGHFVARIKVQ